eukprot:Skav228831  [mRNA]  locus=scaffold4977:8913:10765:- [translate_table: standard]
MRLEEMRLAEIRGDGISGSILAAAESGSAGAIRHFLQMDPKAVDEISSTRYVALHWAVAEGHAEMVQLLLASRAAVDVKAGNGRGPQCRDAVAHELRANCYAKAGLRWMRREAWANGK